jgi:Ca-activated chloride channel family protein
MADGGRLGLVKGSLRSLAEQMTPADRIAVVTYGGAAAGGTVALPPTSGKDRQKVLDAVDALAAAGEPAGGDAGIELAYKLAGQHFARGGVNRVVLCTGRNFAADARDRLAVHGVIGAKVKSNVSLSVIHVGAAQINHPAMRELASRGKGTYAHADTAAEAARAVSAAAAPTPAAIAKDVKVQVEFNPLVAQAYRLIGYENGPRSADEADELLRSGHTVTAMYEVVPAGKSAPGAEVFAMKYSKRPEFLKPSDTNSKEMLTLKLHYLAPPDEKSGKAEDRPGKLLEFAVEDKGGNLAKASGDFKFAAAVTEFALILRGSMHRGEKADLNRVIQLANEGAGPDRSGARHEFIDLARKAQQLRGG